MIGNHNSAPIVNSQRIGAAIIENDDAMVAGKLRRLIKIPHRAVAGGLAQKQKRRAVAGDLVVDVDTVFRFDIRHDPVSFRIAINQEPPR